MKTNTNNRKMATAAALAVVLSVSVGAAQATTITIDDFFGTFGSTADQSTDVNETLAVALFGNTAAGMAGETLTHVTVEVRGSMSTEGTATNNGPTDAAVSATLTAYLGNWQATTSFIGGADQVFVASGGMIINEPIGTVDPHVTVDFGPFTNDSGWLTVYDGMDVSFAGTGDLSYLFETHTASFITGSSNFASAFTTATAGGLRITYTSEGQQPPAVPEPATLALMGLGLAGLGYGRRKARRA